MAMAMGKLGGLGGGGGGGGGSHASADPQDKIVRNAEFLLRIYHAVTHWGMVGCVGHGSSR
jgi:hypothetical protein